VAEAEVRADNCGRQYGVTTQGMPTVQCQPEVKLVLVGLGKEIPGQ
jgi:hypothetical protein